MKLWLKIIVLGVALCAKAQPADKPALVAINVGPAEKDDAPTPLDLTWRVADFAADGDGMVWAIADKMDQSTGHVSAESIKRLAIFDPKSRQWHPQPCEAAADGRAIRLATLSDGAVACLWQSGEQTILTRHRSGKSEAWATLPKVFTEPRLLPLRSAGLAITERGAKAARISKDGVFAEVITLDDAQLAKPEKVEEGNRSYAAVRAIEAGDGSLWLWSFALEPLSNLWRVSAFLRWDDKGVERISGLPFKQDAPISAVVADGTEHVFCAEAGKGLWRLAIQKGEPQQFKAPNDVLAYVEHLQFIHGALHVITCPQPDKISVQMSKTVQNHLELTQERHYNPAKPTGVLYRITSTKLEALKNGIDGEPDFGRTSRAIVTSPEGLLLGTVKGPPWWLPRDNKAVALDQGYGFRLHDAAGIVPLVGCGYLVRAQDTTWTVIDPSVKIGTPPGEVRVSSFRADYPVIEDKRHHLWALRTEPRNFAMWDGNKWTKQEEPSVRLDRCLEPGVDQHDQAWLLSTENKTSAVLDMNSGKWTSFASADQAIQQRLHLGDRIEVPRYFVFGPIAHANGTKGYLGWKGSVNVLLKDNWIRASLTEIEGPEAAASGAPFFSSDGQFCLPINHRHFTLRPDAKWVEIQNPDTSNDRTYRREESSPPKDCTIPNVTSTAYDRHGIAWLTQSDGTLWKWLDGGGAKVAAADRSPPLPLNTRIAQVHVDDFGNAHLRQSGGSGLETYFAITALARNAAPQAKLERVQLGIAEISVSGLSKGWSRMRIDQAEWQPPVQKTKFTTTPMLPGEHRIEVQAFDEELSPLGDAQTLTVKVEAAAASVLSAQIKDLQSADLDTREAAARALKTQGRSALPELERSLQSSADETQRWWLRAVIQAIQRDAAR